MMLEVGQRNVISRIIVLLHRTTNLTNSVGNVSPSVGFPPRLSTAPLV